MKAIRKGNDIHIKWWLVINNGKQKLSDVNLRIELEDSVGKVTTMPFTVTENKYIETDYFGMFHGKLGKYRLTAWINKGQIGQAVVDACDVFKLVACSHEEQGSDSNNVNVETVDIYSNIEIGVQGASAYEIWLRNGHDGTETDFLNWLRGDSAPDILEALQKRIDAIEGVGDETDDIDTLKEIKDFLSGYKNTDTLESVTEEATGEEASEEDIEAMFA